MSSKRIHTDNLILENNGNQDKIFVSVRGNVKRLDFEGMEYVEADKFQTKELYNENSSSRSGNELGAKMIDFDSSDNILLNNRNVYNYHLRDGAVSGGTISNATLVNCSYDLDQTNFADKILTTNSLGNVANTFSTSEIVTKTNDIDLSNKHLDSTCTLDSSLTIGGYTANKMLQSDASGDIEASSFAPTEVILTTGAQDITGVKTMTTPILTNPKIETVKNNYNESIIITGARGVSDGGLVNTSITPVKTQVKNDFVADTLATKSTISHANSDLSTITTCLTLDGSGNVVCTGNLTADNIISGGGGTSVDMTIGTNEVGFPGGAYVNTIGSYSGSTTTLAADTVAITEDLRLNGNKILNGNGNTVLTTFDANQDATFSGKVSATTLQSNNTILGTGGASWISTNNTTTTVSDNIDCSGSIRAINPSVTVKLQISNNFGTFEVAPLNASYCHFSTDRPTFYFDKQVQVAGYLNPYTNGNDLGSTTKRWSLFADTIEASGTCHLAGTSGGVHIRVFQEGVSQNSINSYTGTGSTIEDLGIQTHGGDTYFGLYTQSRMRVMNWGIQRYGINGVIGNMNINYFGGDTVLGDNTTADSNLRVFGEVRAEHESGQGNDIFMTSRNGSLPGYPNDSYPTLKTAYSSLYFSVGGVYSAYLATASVGQIDFTGQHRCVPEEETLFNENLIGRIVFSTGKINSLIPDEDGVHQPTTGKDGIDVVEAVPVVALCDENLDKRCFGVIASIKDDDKDGLKQFQQGVFNSMVQAPVEDNRLTINSLGEGGIWVVNVNGNIKNGDYITTCDVAEGGYGAKQADDLLHNYTCAKATITCNFVLESDKYKCEEFEDGGKTYRKAFISCVYKF